MARKVALCGALPSTPPVERAGEYISRDADFHGSGSITLLGAFLAAEWVLYCSLHLVFLDVVNDPFRAVATLANAPFRACPTSSPAQQQLVKFLALIVQALTFLV